jgi:hypothetical protein
MLEAGEEGAPEVETAEERWLANFVYYEIRDGLVAQGIPRDQIAFIHDAATKAQRDALFAAMNDGRVRVLVGSTGKMSTGMNVQRRLVARYRLIGANVAKDVDLPPLTNDRAQVLSLKDARTLL